MLPEMQLSRSKARRSPPRQEFFASLTFCYAKFALKVPKLKEQLLAKKNSKVKNDKLCKDANTFTLHELLVGIEMNKMIKELDSPHFIHTYGYRCSNDYTQCKEQIVCMQGICKIILST